MGVKTTVFGLLRHAETEWNRDKRIQGVRNAPLTQTGLRAAQSWGAVLQPLNWDLIIASDLDRTFQTAGYINGCLKLPVITEAGLREQDWGEWTGQRLPELEADPACGMTQKTAMGWRFQPPGGENRHTVWKRAHRTLCNIHAAHPGRRILIVTHEGVIKAILYRLLKRNFLPGEPRVLVKKPCLHFISCDGRELRIDKINAVAL